MMQPKTLRDYSVADACAVFNVTPPTIYKMLNCGELKGYKIGRARRITAESINDVRSGKVS